MGTLARNGLKSCSLPLCFLYLAWSENLETPIFLMSKVVPHHLHFAVVDETLTSQFLKRPSVSQLSLNELTPLFGSFLT